MKTDKYYMDDLEILYAALTVEAEDYRRTKGHKPSKWDMVKCLVIDQGYEINKVHIDLIEKLHADGFTSY